MNRHALMRALARVTGESMSFLEHSGFQFHQRLLLPNHLTFRPYRLRRRKRLRNRHQRRVRYRRLF
ncbi:MAG: hypothetical protein U0796_02365 [Gemmatales bacterium]